MAPEKSSSLWITNMAASSSLPSRSPSLHQTLSDVDRKVKAIRALIKEDGDPFDKTSGVISNSKDEVERILEDLYKTYCSLAEEHDKLRSKFSDLQDGYVTSFKTRTILKTTSNEKFTSGSPKSSETDGLDSPPESAVEDPEVEFDIFNFTNEILDKPANEFELSEPTGANLNHKQESSGEIQVDEKQTPMRAQEELTAEILGCEFNDYVFKGLHCEMNWSELKLQLMKLMEENLQHQAELVKRNEEKRRFIRGLQSQLSSLKAENKALQDCLGCSKVDGKRNRFKISNWKELLFGKIFGRNSVRSAQSLATILESATLPHERLSHANQKVYA